MGQSCVAFGPPDPRADVNWGGRAGTAASTTSRLTSFRLAGYDETPDVDGSEHLHVRVEGVKRFWRNLELVGMQPSGALRTFDTRWSCKWKESYIKEGFPKGGGVSTVVLSEVILCYRADLPGNVWLVYTSFWRFSGKPAQGDTIIREIAHKPADLRL